MCRPISAANTRTIAVAAWRCTSPAACQGKKHQPRARNTSRLPETPAACQGLTLQSEVPSTCNFLSHSPSRDRVHASGRAPPRSSRTNLPMIRFRDFAPGAKFFLSSEPNHSDSTRGPTGRVTDMHEYDQETLIMISSFLVSSGGGKARDVAATGARQHYRSNNMLKGKGNTRCARPQQHDTTRRGVTRHEIAHDTIRC